jgi:hypothetical protein
VGALLFTLWYDMPHRATRDADLLGFGASDLASVAETFRDIAAVVVDDGIAFNPASVTVEEIRQEEGYGGVRVIIPGDLARARCKTQIDVGFGDAVTPAPVDSVYPLLLDDLPAPGCGPARRYTVASARHPGGGAGRETGHPQHQRQEPRARRVRRQKERAREIIRAHVYGGAGGN